jgi:hypothetical protein
MFEALQSTLDKCPGRALIHVFNNPSATEGYLSWGYLSKKIGIIYTLSVHINLNFVILDDPICIYKVASGLVSNTLGLLKVCSDYSINHV